MAFIRSHARLALQFVLDYVLGNSDTSGLKKSLQNSGIENIFDLLTTDIVTIDTLTYDKSLTEPDFPVSEDNKSTLVAFVVYVKFLQSSGTSRMSSFNDYIALTPEAFTEYRINQYSPSPNLVWTKSIVSLATPNTILATTATSVRPVRANLAVKARSLATPVTPVQPSSI